MYNRLTLASLFCVVRLVTATKLSLRQEQPASDISINLSGFGPGRFSQLRYANDDTNAQQELFAVAGQTPNLTSSATFQYGASGSSSDDRTWTWRLNITNVDVAPLNQTAFSGQTSTNLQFDLQWPGGGSLMSHLEQQARSSTLGTNIAQVEAPLCATRLSWAMGSNITSRYSNNDNGNCTNVLGEKCAASFLEVWDQQGPCSERQSPIWLDGLVGCNDTLYTSKSGGGQTGTIGNSTWSLPNYKNESLQSGDPILHVTYNPVDASNLEGFEAVQSRLNILLMTGGGSLEPVMLCQVVSPPASSGVPTLSLPTALALSAAFAVAMFIF